MDHLLLLLLVSSVCIIFQYEPLAVEGAWCVARAGASSHALQSALDYACASGADCRPIQKSGLCFLPNTLEAHASYAFNSFYQRNHNAATSCDFSATATLAKTDPSYGSCVYPSSSRTAGSITSTTGGSSPTNPSGTLSPFTPPSTFGTGTGTGTGTSLSPNYMGPPIPTTNESTAAPKSSLIAAQSVLWEILLFLLLSATA